MSELRVGTRGRILLGILLLVLAGGCGKKAETALNPAGVSREDAARQSALLRRYGIVTQEALLKAATGARKGNELFELRVSPADFSTASKILGSYPGLAEYEQSFMLVLNKAIGGRDWGTDYPKLTEAYDDLTIKQSCFSFDGVMTIGHFSMKRSPRLSQWRIDNGEIQERSSGTVRFTYDPDVQKNPGTICARIRDLVAQKLDTPPDMISVEGDKDTSLRDLNRAPGVDHTAATAIPPGSFVLQGWQFWSLIGLTPVLLVVVLYLRFRTRAESSSGRETPLFPPPSGQSDS